jgi:riboflavin synthase
LVLAAPFAAELALAESVAVNGACLTVVAADADSCTFGAGPETLRRTNLGELTPGDRVNLERSLRVGDRLGGHLVQGHIDGLGRIADRQRSGDWEMIWLACPPELARGQSKGSIAVTASVSRSWTSRPIASASPHPAQCWPPTLGFKPIGRGC